MKHFTLQEFTASATARAQKLDNTPMPEHRANLEMLAAMLLDPLREAWAVRCTQEAWGTPALTITSGYRGFQLNQAVGGAASSAHCVGFAADTVPVNGRLKEYKDFCREFLTGRAFDQLISEDEDAAGVPRWLHIAYKDRQGGQRRQLLTMRGGKYKPMSK